MALLTTSVPLFILCFAFIFLPSFHCVPISAGNDFVPDQDVFKHFVPFEFIPIPFLQRSLAEAIGSDLGNFTRTSEQVASCYADRLKGRHLNIFNSSLSVLDIVSHYYTAFPDKVITTRSVESLLNSTKQIITTCLTPNRPNPRAKFGFTVLSDWTQDKLKKMQGIPSGTSANSTTPTKRQFVTDDFHRPECSASDVLSIPERFDWRDHGVVTSVKQQTCASCYIYAAVGAIESALLVHHKTDRTAETLNLSEYQLEDCSPTGCHGGFAEDAFGYVLENGIAYQDQYTRRGRFGFYDDGYYFEDSQTCNLNSATRIFPLRDYCVKTYRTEVGSRIIPDTVIQQHLLKFGPLYVATSTYFYDLVDGIVDDPYCTARGYLNHAVLLVGYDEDTWIIKNSFTEDFGENGYYRIARHNQNICGINTEIAFPLV